MFIKRILVLRTVMINFTAWAQSMSNEDLEMISTAFIDHGDDLDLDQEADADRLWILSGQLMAMIQAARSV